MKCPSRAEGPFLYPEEDSWDAIDDTCSFCGSLNPATLMSRLYAGDVEVSPTDKSYKIYVENFGGEKFKRRFRKDCDMGKPGSNCTGPKDCTHWVTDEVSHSKFYFQHFIPSQQQRFVDMLNEKKLKIAYPGHFYVLPYFIKK